MGWDVESTGQWAGGWTTVVLIMLFLFAVRPEVVFSQKNLAGAPKRYGCTSSFFSLFLKTGFPAGGTLIPSLVTEQPDFITMCVLNQTCDKWHSACSSLPFALSQPKKDSACSSVTEKEKKGLITDLHGEIPARHSFITGGRWQISQSYSYSNASTQQEFLPRSFSPEKPTQHSNISRGHWYWQASWPSLTM